LYLKSAKADYVKSQYKLGFIYEHGLLGLARDPARSIAWYSKSAAQGDPKSELALSTWYLAGSPGVLQRNETEAYLWAHKAAEKGLAEAEYTVAYFTEHGTGCHINLEDARRWYLRAASQGNEHAIARLKGANAHASAGQTEKECKVM
jgi:TPR repeat protein